MTKKDKAVCNWPECGEESTEELESGLRYCGEHFLRVLALRKRLVEEHGPKRER